MSTWFTLQIELGGAAMREGDDIRRALENVIRYVSDDREFLDENNDVVYEPSGRVMDGNGNQVGEWRVAETREHGSPLSARVYDALMGAGHRALADEYADLVTKNEEES